MDREAIRTKALELFKRISFQKTSISDIAKACDMGKGTFYLYYENKDEIFSSILEERSAALEKKYGRFYGDPAIPLEKKIRQYFENLVDEYFVIKDLLFGSFENVQTQMLKDVFFKYNRYYLRSIEHLVAVVSSNSRHKNLDRLRESLTEFMELMVGRMLVYIMVHEWNDREGLKKVISPLSEKLFASLVVA